ncbi:MAG: S8 family peptidase [Microcella sp.]|uniref:S8 family peptidase n=1 Tax=Microcella sp. TaxID=1913979 RepID=UPI00271CD857|nr:S8 family peptidase [Microcella sp.]MDO8337798.1 S8 family peptidase [Microcella sp.]
MQVAQQIKQAEYLAREQEDARASSIVGASFSFSGEDLASTAKSLGDTRSGLEVLTVVGGEDVIVYAPAGLGALRRKVSQYGEEETRTGQPKNNALVSRLETVQLTTVDVLSFGEIHAGDLDPRENYLVEVWLPKEPQGGVSPLSSLHDYVSEQGSEILDVYSAMDRDVALARVTGAELIRLPAEIPFTAELHIPARVRLVSHAEQRDAQGYEIGPIADASSTAVVAIHDTGWGIGNPYLDSITIARDSVVPGEPPEPSAEPSGSHGAEMAGLAAFGDLADQLESGEVFPQARVVSVKLVGGDDQALWAERTRLAISTAEALSNSTEVIHNLSIGAANVRSDSRSIWSIAIDELAWNGGAGRLIVVAAGNADPFVEREAYPNSIFGRSIDHPAEAWNAITVGGITALDLLGPEDEDFSAPEPLAQAGEVSPYTSAGPGGLRPIKPDIASEAGNTAPGGGIQGAGLQGLSLLTTASPLHSRGRLLSRAWATSAAAAVTSNDLAFISNSNPGLRPATVRGLLTNSAVHTTTLNRQFPSKTERLRAVGYGPVDRDKAAFSSSNRPVLFHEGTLSPRRARGSGRAADREVVLIRLPFPDDVLEAIHDRLVRLSVTLSYFVEPTASLARRDYPGCRLKWDLQGPLETEDGFEARINRLVREQGVDRGSGSYPWEIGENERSRGSLQHDTCVVPASALAGERVLAVFPVLGWWDYRKESMLNAIDFSVVASIDLGDVDLDIYTPISVSVEQEIEI